MQNPKAALAAFNASKSVKVGPFDVREITLGLGGVLEQIGSPIFTGEKPKRVHGWIPTLYAMTHTTPESERLLAKGVEAFNAAAREWADADVPYGLTTKLIDAVNASVRRLNAISGDSGDDEGKDAEKNGSEAGQTAG